MLDSASAQETTIRRWNVKTAPLQLLFPSIRTWNVNVEYVFDRNFKSSLSVNPYLIYWNERGDTTTTQSGIGNYANHRGVGAILTYKYYFLGFIPRNSSAQKGGYVSSFIQPEYLSVDFVNVKSSFSIRYMDGRIVTGRENGRNIQNIFSFQTGLTIGYQWIWWQRVALDVHGGVAYRYSQSSFKNDMSEGVYYYPMPENNLDYAFEKAYTGLLPKLGFQIGFAF
jgi:hypothetical protein